MISKNDHKRRVPNMAKENTVKATCKAQVSGSQCVAEGGWTLCPTSIFLS